MSSSAVRGFHFTRPPCEASPCCNFSCQVKHLRSALGTAAARGGYYVGPLGLPVAIVVSRDLLRWYPLYVNRSATRYNHSVNAVVGGDEVYVTTGARAQNLLTPLSVVGEGVSTALFSCFPLLLGEDYKLGDAFRKARA